MCYTYYSKYINVFRDRQATRPERMNEMKTKKVMYKLTMKLIGIHSSLLLALGFNKWQIRDYSPVRHLLISAACRLAVK